MSTGRSGSEWRHLDPINRRLETFRIATKHFGVGKQMVSERDRLSLLKMGVRRDHNITNSFGLID